MSAFRQQAIYPTNNTPTIAAIFQGLGLVSPRWPSAPQRRGRPLLLGQ
jgi:hypothetical protein